MSSEKGCSDTYQATGDPMTDNRTCEETNDDPLLPRKVWRSAVWEFFLSKGCAEEEMILDEHGDVIGVLLHERHFVGPQKPHIWRLANTWAAADESFCPPDGRPVYRFKELATLKTMSDAEQIEFLNSKLH
jgi:hypothetical protein